MANRRFLQGNSHHDRSFLQSIKADSSALLIKVNELRMFQGRLNNVDVRDPDTSAKPSHISECVTMINSGSESRVLLVGDDKSVLEEAVKALKGAGFRCEKALNAREALARLQEYPDISVVVVDLRMQEMDGINLMAALEDQFALAVRPEVIALSGHLNAETASKALRRGAIDCLTKPVSSNALIQSVRSAADRIIGKRATLCTNRTLSGLIGGMEALLAQGAESMRSSNQHLGEGSAARNSLSEMQSTSEKGRAEQATISRLLEERAERCRLFPFTFDSEHAWAMLLEMAQNYFSGRNTYLSALAVDMRLPVSTSSRQLEVLEKEGLATRFPDPNDKRRVRAALTPDGLSRVKEYLASMQG